MGWTTWTESSLGDARGFPWHLLHPLGDNGMGMTAWTESRDARGFPWRLLHPLGTTGWDGQLGQSLAWGTPRDSLGVPGISWGPGDGQPLAVTTYLSVIHAP